MLIHSVGQTKALWSCHQPGQLTPCQTSGVAGKHPSHQHQMAILPPTWCWWQGSPVSRHSISGRVVPLQGAGAALWAPWTLLSAASLPRSQASHLLAGAEHAQIWFPNLCEIVLCFCRKAIFTPTFHLKWKKIWPLSVQGSVCQHWKGWLHSAPGYPRQIFFLIFQ